MKRGYLRQCLGKHRHETQANATRELRKSGRRGLNAYPCDYCDGWHVGHRPGTARERTKPADPPAYERWP